MLKFSPELRKVYPKNGMIFDEIERLDQEIRKHLRSELKAADVSVVAKIPHKTQVLLQVGLRRVIELADSTIRELNATAVIPPFVTTRALFETACVMYYTLRRATSVLKSHSPVDFDRFDDDVMQLLLGNKGEGWGGPIHAKNILTIIDHVDKVFEGTRAVYDDLSEIAHPNYAGMLHVYERPDLQERRAIFVDQWRENTKALPLVVMAFRLSLEIVRHTLRKFEERLPEFIRVCEEDIYRRGTWPEDIPYRWGT